MARPKKKPMPEAPVLRVPRPTHKPVVLTLCGDDHTYTEPARRIDADELDGMRAAVVSQMATVPTCAALFEHMATRIIQADDEQAEARKVEEELRNTPDMVTLYAGFRLAIRPLLRFVITALRMTSRQAMFLEENYDIEELINAFNVIGGLLARPTLGSRNATKRAPRTPTD